MLPNFVQDLIILGLKKFMVFTIFFKDEKKNHNTFKIESIGLILQNWKLICVIGTIQSYLGFWRERLNFGITVAEIQPKVWERRRKRWREKMLNFSNSDTEFPLPSSAARAWSARSEKEKIKKIKFDKRIVAMPLPK